MRAAILASLLSLGCAGADLCFPVAGDPVRVSDLKAAFPELGAATLDAPLAPAPAPGVRRIVGPREIAGWAIRAGIPLPAARTICLVRLEQELNPDVIKPVIEIALKEAFGTDNELDWQILSVRPSRSPPGKVRFLRGGLTRAGAGLGTDVHTWRGRLAYDNGRRSLPVSVSLQLSRRRQIWKAARDLPANSALQDDQLTAAEVRESPIETNRFPEPGTLAGRRLRRPVSAGQVLLSRDLEPVYAIERGSAVTAEAGAGGARIAVPAIAETRGQAGQRVLLRNPETRKTFAGRALGKGRVEVDPVRATGAKQ